MSNVEEFPASARRPTEYEALLTAAPDTLDAIPGAVYICDEDGWLVRYNREAVALWGRQPELGEPRDRFCGSARLFHPDGQFLPHDECPMAVAVRTGVPTRNAEIIIERSDGSRITALVNIRTLKDHRGKIQGAINFFQDITARKQIEEELRRKSKDLEDFFENSAIGLHIVSGDGIILRANKAELHLLGYSEDEYVGRHIAEFHADAPVIGDILHRLSCGEKLDRYPARLRAKDGSIKHVLITSNSRFDDGKFINTRCFTTDVTDLHEAELARRESDKRLAATYEAATVAIAEADEKGRLLRVNDALCKILGRSREQLLTMTFFDFTSEEHLQEDADLYARQVSGDLETYSVRKRAIRGDGTFCHLDVFSSTVRDAYGRFLYGVRVVQDVTKAKRLEDELRESERHMRELLEALPAAVYTTDAKGRINFYNKAAVEMAGRTPEPGQQWCVSWRLFWPDGTPLAHNDCPMAISLRENRAVRGIEAVAERPDGTRIPFMPFPTPLHDSDGNLIGAINMLVDISERKEAEARQKVLIDELNHRVKNTLATVQSLARQTARHTTSLKEFTGTFETRLMALARAHDLLTKRQWRDAPLENLIQELLAPFEGGLSDRMSIKGPSISIAPRIALSITMALNELLTNAVKYGSLSTTSGTLALGWELCRDGTDTRLDLMWRERGGPSVSPPSRRGFGTRLIERCIEADLGGELDLIYEAEGVTCRMVVPIGRKTA